MPCCLLLNFLLYFIVSVFSEKPNIIYILSDDVGFADTSLFGNDAIPTDEILNFCQKGTTFSQHYVQSSCTPTRASLMTGRYAANVGLNMAMLPGAPYGIPSDMKTIPQILKDEAGYATHMVGKWHLGEAKWDFTPVGKGFQTHVGSYLWAMGYYDKSIWEDWWEPGLVDWVKAHENGTYEHYLEERHTTEALTDEAEKVMKKHSEENSDQPLFLYLAFTAAHSPLQTQPEYEKYCEHLPHAWRKNFCALMVGLDKAVERVTKTALETLGENTIIVFGSDNGGATWFGGQNYPLRGTKLSPFEGGVRVPFCVVDYSKKMFPKSGHYGGKMHVSDWLPTLSSVAGVSDEFLENLNLDGINMKNAIKNHEESPRSDVLLEMHYGTEGEHIFNEDVAAYVQGKYKFIESTNLRENNWYVEPTDAYLKTKDPMGWVAYCLEWFIHKVESNIGHGPFETVHDMLVYLFLHGWFAQTTENDSIYLFDLENDLAEKHNIAHKHPEIVNEIQEKVQKIKKNRPEQFPFWMTLDRDYSWRPTFKTGKCNPEKIEKKYCRFVHPYLSDEVKVSSFTLVNGASPWPFIRNIICHYWKEILGFPFLLFFLNRYMVMDT